MRAFESIRKLLVTSDSSNCLKQKKTKTKKSDYHGSCLYKPWSVLVQGTVYPAMLQGLGAPLSLDIVVGQAPSLCPKFTFSARRAERELFLSISHQNVKKGIEELFEMGAETLILGCTELPLAKEMYNLDYPSVDPTLELAKEVIKKAGGEIVD